MRYPPIPPPAKCLEVKTAPSLQRALGLTASAQDLLRSLQAPLTTLTFLFPLECRLGNRRVQGTNLKKGWDKEFSLLLTLRLGDVHHNPLLRPHFRSFQRLFAGTLE